MKINLKVIAAALVAGTMALGAASCGEKPDYTYKGSNKVYLSVNGLSELVAKDGEEMKVDMMLTTALSEDLTLTFGFINDKVDGTAVVEFEGNPVTIPAGETKASILVKPNNPDSVIEDQLVKVTLKNSSNVKVTLAVDIEFVLKPEKKPEPLTDKQKALIAGYLEKGLDLMHWIGRVPFEVELQRTAIEGTWGMFLESDDLKFSGTTIITLSDKATADKPVLEMTSNAMGLRAYLYKILRELTVLDTDFWTQSPSPQTVMDAIDLSATSKESFELSLDNIALNEDKTIDFVSEVEDDLYIVDFSYSYSAWDRLQKAMEESAMLTQAVEQGGSLDPAYYLNLSTIEEDDWGGDNWFQYTSSYDSETGVMSFAFPMDYASPAEDYMKIKVTYSSAKQ